LNTSLCDSDVSTKAGQVQPGEASVLVLGMSRNEAERVGRAFGQLAIVWSGETAVPELVVLRRSG
jgi:hypothetical protein